jgi:monoamine oxidase
MQVYMMVREPGEEEEGEKSKSRMQDVLGHWVEWVDLGSEDSKSRMQETGYRMQVQWTNGPVLQLAEKQCTRQNLALVQEEEEIHVAGDHQVVEQRHSAA